MQRVTVITLSLLSTFLFATASFALTGTGDEGQYKVLPFPQGGIKQTKKNAYVGHTVKDKNNQTVGTLNSVVLDTMNGTVVAGVVRLPLSNDRSALEVVPWNNIHIDPQSGDVHLKVTLKELVPSAVTPQIREIVKGIEEQT